MANIVQITGYVVACLATGPQSTDYLNFVSQAIMIYCEDDYKLYLVFTDGPLPDWATNTYVAEKNMGIGYLNGVNTHITLTYFATKALSLWSFSQVRHHPRLQLPQHNLKV